MNINKLSTTETANYVERVCFPRRFDSLSHEEIGRAIAAMYTELATTAGRSPVALVALGLELRGELLALELATKEAEAEDDDDDESEDEAEDEAEDDDDDDDIGHVFDSETEPDPASEPAPDPAKDPPSAPPIEDTQEI